MSDTVEKEKKKAKVVVTPETEGNEPMKDAGKDADPQDGIAPAAGQFDEALEAEVKTKGDKEDDQDADDEDKDAPKKVVEKKKVSVKEDVDAIFAGQDLSEDFKVKATTIFEAALNARLSEEVEKLEEQAQIAIAEQTAEIKSELLEQQSEYLDQVVTEWTEENKLALENGLKLELAESFLTDIRALMEKHGIVMSMTEDAVNVLEQKDVALASANDEIKTLKESGEAMAAELFALKKEKVFNESVEGLADTQAEKLRKLSEGLDVKTIEEYTEKLDILKSSVFEAKEETKAKATELSESSEIDPKVAQYLGSFRHFNGN